jgi:hypothetical protein
MGSGSHARSVSSGDDEEGSSSNGAKARQGVATIMRQGKEQWQ